MQNRTNLYQLSSKSEARVEKNRIHFQKSSVPIVKRESDPSLQWFTPNSSCLSEAVNIHTNSKSKKLSRSMGSISDSIASFSTVEIPIIIEDRTRNLRRPTIDLNVSAISKTSTYNGDETLTFYEDKYIPEYMNAKNLLSMPLEFFEDNDNLVYARVKL